MSTRGAYGFKINNQEKILFSYADSYTAGLGKTIVEFLQGIDLNRLKKQAQNLQPIPKKFVEKSPLASSAIWNSPQEVLKGIYQGTVTSYVDASGFLDEPIFCEYFYLINLDTGFLEFHQLGRILEVAQLPLEGFPPDWQSKILQALASQAKFREDFFNKSIPVLIKKHKR